MARILIQTYGCTLNQADSRIMKSILENQGHSVTLGEATEETVKNYDFVILNTCTVKTPTEQKILNKISKLKALNTRLIVAGCLASASPEKVEKASPQASIVSTQNVTRIGEAIEKIGVQGKVVMDKSNITDKMFFYKPEESIIARIPVAEGCLSNCSFCETKFARGPLNSFSEKLILAAVKESIKRGAKEIEITAQDTGAYGLDKKTDIAELLSKIVELEGDFKVRLGMLNPEHLNRYFDRLVEVYQNEKMYKFIHLPVQSGSNKVLKDMRRNYTIEEFEDYIKELRSKINLLSVETDMIVGFPTETREDFEESCELLKRIRPDVTNVSKFGARPHADASKLEQLPNSEIKERSVEMSRIVRSIQAEKRKMLIGSIQKVLLTEKNAHSTTGRTSNYLTVALNFPSHGLGEYVNARITAATSASLIGEEIQPSV